MSQIEDMGPRLPIRSGTGLMGLSPEEISHITEGWREAELRRVTWLRSRPSPTEDQLLEAELIEAQHRGEDAVNTFGLRSERTAAAMNEVMRLVELRTERTFMRRPWQQQVQRALQEEDSLDRFLAWRWLTRVYPERRSIVGANQWY